MTGFPDFVVLNGGRHLDPGRRRLFIDDDVPGLGQPGGTEQAEPENQRCGCCSLRHDGFLRRKGSAVPETADFRVFLCRPRAFPAPDVPSMIPAMFTEAPLDCGRATVLPEWVDYNGHMNVGYYVLAIDQALDRSFDRFDCGKAYVERTNRSFFVLETHVRYLREVTAGAPLAFSFQLIGHDAKRLHYFIEMRHAEDGFLSATSEQIALHVDLGTRKTEVMPDHLQALFAEMAAAHAALPAPDGLGRVMGLGRKS